MDRDQKKIAAAAMAVVRCLEAEREQAEASPAGRAAGPAMEGSAARAQAGAFWAASGRLSAMQIRNLMQLRMFRKD
jgi:hypothetical protein